MGVLLWVEWSENASLRRWPQLGPGDKAPVCRVQGKSIPEREREGMTVKAGRGPGQHHGQDSGEG